MTRRRLTLAIAAAALACAAYVAAQGWPPYSQWPITHVDFETGDLSGWSEVVP